MALTPAYIGWPPSFEPTTTVPALNSLPLFVLELVKAEKAPAEATAPTAPTTIRLVSALRAREVLVMEKGSPVGASDYSPGAAGGSGSRPGSRRARAGLETEFTPSGDRRGFASVGCPACRACSWPSLSSRGAARRRSHATSHGRLRATGGVCAWGGG